MSSLRAFANRLPPVVGQLGFRGVRATAVLPGFVRFLRDRRTYEAMPGAERLLWRDMFPKVADRVLTAPYDAHYLPQDTWAAQRVAEFAPSKHVDVGSRLELACFLTAVTRVEFVDIRPLRLEVEGLTSVQGSVLDLPYPDRSVESISCLHVAEHVGLGRYGDTLNPRGSAEAMRDLQRVVAPGGQLLFSLPVGRSRVCFNAHRIHDPRAIVEAFDDLELVEFAGVDDDGVFARHRKPEDLVGSVYACGIYHFKRPT